MTVFTLYHEFDSTQRYQSLNFAADPNLKSLLFQRMREIDSEILELAPEIADPVDYIRRQHDLHASKQEIGDLFNLLQQINNEAKQTADIKD